MVFKSGEVYAVLPLVDTGKAWVSLPHFSYGGILLKKGDKTFSIEQIIEQVSDKAWIYRSYCATCTGHVVPLKTMVV